MLNRNARSVTPPHMQPPPQLPEVANPSTPLFSPVLPRGGVKRSSNGRPGATDGCSPVSPRSLPEASPFPPHQHHQQGGSRALPSHPGRLSSFGMAEIVGGGGRPASPLTQQQQQQQYETGCASPSPFAQGGGGANPTASGPQGGVAVEAFLSRTMPRGRYVLLNLLSTWGDPCAIGLTGVEIYDGNGSRLVPANSDATAFCIVDDYTGSSGGGGGGPVAARSVSPMQPMPPPLMSDGASGGHGGNGVSGAPPVANLVNGRNNTHDEANMYLIPYTPGAHHLVCFMFHQPVEIACMRFYNYNAGRVNTSKGARMVEVTVDDKLAFRGEVREASGHEADSSCHGETDCEVVLFTEDEQILMKVLRASPSAAAAASQRQKREGRSSRRGDKKKSAKHAAKLQLQQQQQQQQQQQPTPPLQTAERDSDDTETDDDQLRRTASSIVTFGGQQQSQQQQQFSKQSNSSASSVALPAAAFPHSCPRGVTSMCILVESTWGDALFVGVSGLRVRDLRGADVAPLISEVFVARPSGRRDIHDTEIAALFDSDPLTACVWAFESGLQLVVSFAQPLDLGFIEIANYSLGRRTHCGLKVVEVFLSQQAIPATTASVVTQPQHSPTSAGVTTFGRRHSSAAAAQYARLWDRADVGATAQSLAVLQQGLLQVTPPRGLALRKAPAHLLNLRFQSFDLSAAAVSASSLGGGGDGLTMTSSMSQSMVIRATSAMRRARMQHLPVPEWLEVFQPCQTPLLPVGYVFKLVATILADTPQALKSQLKLWTMEPSRVCSFYGDDNALIATTAFAFEGIADISLGARQQQHQQGDPYGASPSSAAMAAVVSDDEGSSVHHRAVVSLFAVADVPLALAALTLNVPLASKAGGCAWVASLAVLADDALVFQSEEQEVHPSQDRSGGSAMQPVVFFTLDDRLLSELRL